MLQFDNIRLERDGFDLTADFKLEEGACYSILGPSGAGKSTLLSLVGGFEAPRAGRVVFRDTPLTGMSPIDRNIAQLFQDNNLFPHLTAGQNVGLGIRPSLKLSKEEHEAVRNALRATGLEGFEDRVPGALSGGQQSRVALARVLVQRHPLVLLDEPFSALGPAMRKDMIELAKDVSRQLGATCLMVSHDLSDAKRFSDNLIWVADGKAHAPRTWSDVAESPPPGFLDYIGAQD